MPDINQPRENASNPFFPEDNDIERLVYAQFVMTGRVSNAVSRFSEGTGDGGYEVTDYKKFEETINKLLDTATKEMITNMPLDSKKEIRRAVEKVLMRELMLLSPEKKDVQKFLPVLNIQTSVRDAMEKFGFEGEKSFDQYFKGDKN